MRSNILEIVINKFSRKRSKVKVVLKTTVHPSTQGTTRATFALFSLAPRMVSDLPELQHVEASPGKKKSFGSPTGGVQIAR